MEASGPVRSGQVDKKGSDTSTGEIRSRRSQSSDVGASPLGFSIITDYFAPNVNESADNVRNGRRAESFAGPSEANWGQIQGNEQRSSALTSGAAAVQPIGAMASAGDEKGPKSVVPRAVSEDGARFRFF